MTNENDSNPDPITGAPGAHPIGTGLGAAGGAAAGAAAGAMGGPAGAVVGGVAGAVVGGLAGKAGAEAVNPTVEDSYWRERYDREPYYRSGLSYDDYGPAYALGWSSGANYRTDFDSAEPELARQWELQRGGSSLSWPDARHATRAAWERVTGGDAVDTTQPMDNDDVIDTLNDLIETCYDGEYGFKACVERTETAQLKSVFEQRARDCASSAAELANEVLRLGGVPEDGGTVAGAAHRGWVAVRGMLSGDTDLAVLEECERGEDSALARYRKAMKQNLPADIRTLVERQMQGVQKNHDMVKTLRDEYRLRA